jgi:hypothetical protein
MERTTAIALAVGIITAPMVPIAQSRWRSEWRLGVLGAYSLAMIATIIATDGSIQEGTISGYAAGIAISSVSIILNRKLGDSHGPTSFNRNRSSHDSNQFPPGGHGNATRSDTRARQSPGSHE